MKKPRGQALFLRAYSVLRETSARKAAQFKTAHTMKLTHARYSARRSISVTENRIMVIRIPHFAASRRKAVVQPDTGCSAASSFRDISLITRSPSPQINKMHPESGIRKARPTA